MAISHKNGIALTGVSAINGIASISAINGISASLGGGGGATFSDDFNRSNEIPIAGDWDGAFPTLCQLMLFGNRVEGIAGGTYSSAIARVKTSTQVFSGNHSAAVTLESGALVYNGPAVKVQSDGSCYVAYQVSSVVKVVKLDAATGATTQIGSDIAVTPAGAGEVLKLEATGDGGSVSLVVSCNGTAYPAVVDSSSPLTGGQPGIGCGIYGVVDNFEAADVVASGPTLVAHDTFDTYADSSLVSSQPNYASVSGSLFVGNPTSTAGFAYSIAGEVRRTDTFNSDQRVEVTLKALPGSFQFVVVGVRFQTSTGDNYNLSVDGLVYYLSRTIGGSWINLSGHAGAALALTAGDKIALQVTGAGSAARLTVQKDTGAGWVDVATNVDPTVYLDGGTPTIGCNGGGSQLDDAKFYNL